jgi:prepilin-type N-terminal cleavage/methylation domain-containing protein
MYKRSADSQGFTLIELTVVILTIAILMGFVFTAGQGALDRARKTQAKNDLTQIVTAVNAYYTEYGRNPIDLTFGAVDVEYGNPDTPLHPNSDVMNALRAIADSGPNSAIAASLGKDRSYGKLPSGGTAPTGDYKYKGSDDVLSWQ